MDEVNEIVDSVKNAIKERLGSIMYGMFLISWIGWNWQVIYTTLFIDQNIILANTGLLKIDYIKNIYTNKWIFTRNIILGPIISTYLIIWWLSKIDLICSRKNYSNKAKKELEKAKIEKNLLKEKQSILDERIETVRKEKIITQELTKEQRWSMDFKDISSTKIYRNAMEDLEICLYKHDGYLSIDGFPNYHMKSENISFLHTNDIVNFVEGTRNQINLTEKGKYYLREFIKNKKDSYI
ncbi:MAG: hypothetical protein QG603_277 [Patescibacteria group bacterium]|nr:hypothetical protein [Patescibacteria group bacterium]MDQ5970500.1 hypothetical protein [Patescibacteria group bacterium]